MVKVLARSSPLFPELQSRIRPFPAPSFLSFVFGLRPSASNPPRTFGNGVTARRYHHRLPTIAALSSWISATADR